MRITISPQAPLQTRPTTYVRTYVPTIAPCQLTILYYAFAHFTTAGKVIMHAGVDSRMVAVWAIKHTNNARSDLLPCV